MSIAERMGGMAAGDKKSGMAERLSSGPKPEPAAGGSAHTTLHDHGDGTFHSEGHDGEKMEHPSIGHALMHLAGKHGDGGKHLHAHQGEDGSHTTHQHDGSQVQGPHDHENIEALKEHLGKFFDEEGSEKGGGYESSGGHNSIFGE